jgi:outer membrane protein assembly factor BamD (BamD/ComL family)
MKKGVRLIFCTAATVLLLFGCKPSQEQRISEIVQAEQETANDFDTTKLNRLRLLYHTFVSDYPTDSLAAQYLFQAGRTAMLMQDGRQALTDFASLVNRYPNSRWTADCFFHRAYVYENVMYDMVQAKRAYEDFINRYPDHPLVQDALLSIRYLGKDPSEIVAGFEAVDDSTATQK